MSVRARLIYISLKPSPKTQPLISIIEDMDRNSGRGRDSDVVHTDNVIIDVLQPTLEKCMFCLEDVPRNDTPRACLCLLQHHDSCYSTWLQMYGTICPLCRKTPVPIVNPETLQLEFELVTNGVDPGHTLAPSLADNVANYRENVVSTNRRLNTIVLMFFVSCMIVLSLTLVIALRIFNVV
jgi:hypothetical protein